MALIRSKPRRVSTGDEIDADILLVEDQRSLAEMAAKMLHERWGCRVLIATNLAQVKTILAQNKRKFFLAISDLNLPDAPNGEVVDVLIAAKLKVIAMTGMFDPALHDRIMSKGVIDYVLKDSINAYEYIVEQVGRLHRNLSTKVLVVDDSASFRTLAESMLKVQGMQVVLANDGVEGLAMLDQHRDIKLVLVDHEMPNMDGFNFLFHVRRKWPKDRLAVIGMAGSGNPKLSAQFLKLGASDFLFKTCSYDELVCRIRQNLEMQESIAAVRYVANHDYLTGLINRRAFFDEGNILCANHLKAGTAVAAAVMDIDFFKKINDQFGHDGGDEALRHLAVLIKEHFTTQLVARAGGEEFFILFDEPKEALSQCESFRIKVARSHVPFAETAIAYTMSIGLCIARDTSLDAILTCADECLYRAKQGGRNRTMLIDTSVAQVAST
ncbi:MAG: diguanylate cyclase [Gallionella sp.]|nr:diguanylate cyclase [Gallionella sp.]